MTIETEPWGGVVVRWPDAWLLFDPCGAWFVWRGHVITRVVVGEA